MTAPAGSSTAQRPDAGRPDPGGGGTRRWADRFARLGTEALAPWVLSAAMPIVVAVDSAATVRAGVGWGLFAAACSSAAPMARILSGMRLGTITDHHVSRREQRKGVVLFGVAAVTVSLVVAIGWAAPRPLVAMIAVMLAVLLCAGVVNLWWKLSVHTAVGAGSIVVLAIMYGPTMLLATPLLGWVGWSRVHLRAHTVAQVWAGAALGTALAWPLFTLLP